MVAWETLQHQPHRREVTKRPQRQGSPLARAAHGGRGHASRFMKKILYLKTLFTQTCGLCTKYTRIPLLVPTFLPGCLNLGLPTLCPQLPQLRVTEPQREEHVRSGARTPQTSVLCSCDEAWSRPTSQQRRTRSAFPPRSRFPGHAAVAALQRSPAAIVFQEETGTSPASPGPLFTHRIPDRFLPLSHLS